MTETRYEGPKISRLIPIHRNAEHIVARVDYKRQFAVMDRKSGKALAVFHSKKEAVDYEQKRRKNGPDHAVSKDVTATHSGKSIP